MSISVAFVYSATQWKHCLGRSLLDSSCYRNEMDSAERVKDLRSFSSLYTKHKRQSVLTQCHKMKTLFGTVPSVVLSSSLVMDEQHHQVSVWMFSVVFNICDGPTTTYKNHTVISFRGENFATVHLLRSIGKDRMNARSHPIVGSSRASHSAFSLPAQKANLFYHPTERCHEHCCLTTL